jgi:hypothetical protein
MQRLPKFHRSFSTISASALLLSGGLAIGGCKKEEPKTEPAKTASTDPKAPATKDAPTDTKTPPTTTKVDPTTPVSPADALQPPSSTLQRGEVLGHVMITNPSTFLGEIKNQIVPAAQAQFVDESFLRMAGGAALGSRSKLATNIDLGKPIGCALVDLASAPLPLVCVVGYKGGASALVEDLGADGKQGDPAGHVAKYVVEGQELYIDEAEGGAIISNHAEAYAKGKTYVETNLIGRASAVASDVELVAFPGAAYKRYEKELAPILAMVGKMPTPSGGNPMSDALAAYGTKSNAQMVENLKGMDQVTVALGLEPVGFVARFAVFPAPGSQYEAQAKLAAAGPLDAAFVRKLPATSWGVLAFNAHLSEAMSSPMTKELRNVFLDAYSEGVGKDKAATQAAVDTFLTEAKATYSGHTSLAVMHEPGTLGGAVMVSGLQAGVSAREGWKTWATGFTPESVLGSEGAKKVTWAFQFDAAKVGEIPVDRWVIEPTEESKAQIRKEGGAELAEWETKLGGLKLVINRAETDGKVAWIVGPGNDDKYAKAVVDALGGTGSLDGNAGATKILDRNPGASAVFAVDVKGLFGWLGEIVPPAERAKMPTGIGTDLSDFFMAQSYGETGAQSGEFVMSQALIDQLKALAK